MEPTDSRAPTQLPPTVGDEPAAPAARVTDLPRSDRYQVGGPLGVGGMGEVLVARDTHLGRDVAIKRLRAAAPSSDTIGRFVREARIQGRLQHPAIVPIHDLAVDESGRPFFAMKQLAGTTLHDLVVAGAGGASTTLGAGGAWSRARLLRAFVEVCLAIEFAHTRGVIHRDIKPANIALGDFGEVYILDWGVARILGDSRPDTIASVSLDDADAPRVETEAVTIDDGATGAGAILGTPGYMPPEQIRGDIELGPAADIYALGCVLFEILAGQPMHPRALDAAIAATLAEGEHRPSRRAPDRDVSPELDEICARATAARPDARYGSARALGEAVQSYLDGDRDLALRQRLAADHLAEARAALARGDGGGASDVDRRAAMRAAAHALALDPSSVAAAELVSHLVLEPPRQIPREVRDRLDALDVEAAHAHARAGAIAVAIFLAAFPLFALIGIRDWLTVGATFVAGAVHLGSLVATVRSPRPARYTWLSVGAYAVVVALVGRFFNPFVLATGLAVLGAALAGAHPGLRRIGVALAIYVATVLVPWGLELVGVISSTYFLRGEEVVIVPPVLHSARPGGEIGIAIYVLAVILMCGILTWRISQQQRDARNQLELQAWHLRQLVPRPR